MNLKEMGEENAYLQQIPVADCTRHRPSESDCNCSDVWPYFAVAAGEVCECKVISCLGKLCSLQGKLKNHDRSRGAKEILLYI